MLEENERLSRVCHGAMEEYISGRMGYVHTQGEVKEIKRRIEGGAQKSFLKSRRKKSRQSKKT